MIPVSFAGGGAIEYPGTFIGGKEYPGTFIGGEVDLRLEHLADRISESH
jgi:hypothetical protein